MKTREKVKLFFLFIFYCVITQQVFAQKRTISGTVTSADEKEALIGVSITIKGNEAIGTITDPEGKYSLQVEPDQTLIVSYIGMKTAEIRVPRKNSVLNIVLEPESMNLDEVVVTGYGNFTKSSFTGSANTLKADMLKDIPVMSVEQKLQGMTTGVNITSSSGQPGANQNIRIRGMGSFNASQEPLFVIDGVPVTSGSLSAGGSDAAYMNNSKTNIMSTLNPADIENITVIKDAAAASLYGSRAANGVILITTKKGSAGRAQVTLNISGGFSNAAVDFRPTLNGDQRTDRPVVEAIAANDCADWTKLEFTPNNANKFKTYTYDITRFADRFSWGMHLFYPDPKTTMRTYRINPKITVKFKGHDTQVYNYPDMEFVPFSLASQHADNPYIHNVSGNGNLKFQGRPGANNTANIVFQGFSAGAFPEIDQWAFMQPVALNTISPDTGLNIKGVTDDLPSYSYTYTEPGTYTVTFIVAGGNYQGQSAPAPYEVTFTVIDPIE